MDATTCGHAACVENDAQQRHASIQATSFHHLGGCAGQTSCHWWICVQLCLPWHSPWPKRSSRTHPTSTPPVACAPFRSCSAAWPAAAAEFWTHEGFECWKRCWKGSSNTAEDSLLLMRECYCAAGSVSLRRGISKSKQPVRNSTVRKCGRALHHMGVEEECVGHKVTFLHCTARLCSCTRCTIVLLHAQAASLERQSALQARKRMASHECWRRMCMSQFFTALHGCAVLNANSWLGTAECIASAWAHGIAWVLKKNVYVTVLPCTARVCLSTRKQLVWNSRVHCKRVSAWHHMSVEGECVRHSSSLRCTVVLFYAQTASLEQLSALQARKRMASHECWRRMCMSQFFTALHGCAVLNANSWFGTAECIASA